MWVRIEVKEIDIKFEKAGTPLIYARDGNVTVANLKFTGQLEMCLISVQNSLAVLRGLTLRISWANSLVLGMMNAYIDILFLQDIFVTLPCSRCPQAVLSTSNNFP